MDDRNLGMLFEAYNETMVCKATRMLKGDRQRAEDITQEIWLGLSGRLESWYDERRGEISTYLMGSLIRRVAGHYRSKLQEKEESLVDCPRATGGYRLEGWGSVPAVDGDPAHLAAAHENGYLIKDVLLSLPHISRQAIGLYVLQEKLHSEAAAYLGIGEASFRSRVCRARTEFREEYVKRTSEKR